MQINKIFKKYDIRAVIEKELPISCIEDLSKAICSYFLSIDPEIDEILLAFDSRVHSQEIKNIFIKAALDSGLNIRCLGICPTPVAYFATKYLNAKAAVVITASHNPKDYNGFKIIYKSAPIWDLEIQKIKDIYFEISHDPFALSAVEGCERINPNVTEIPIHEVYIKFLAQEFAHLKNLDINITIDCCNGTAGTIIPQLVRQMGWEKVECIFTEPDGNFPNHDPDPSKEKNLAAIKNCMQNDASTYGFAFDGDCDRLVVLYNDSQNIEAIQADKLLYIFAQSLGSVESFQSNKLDIATLLNAVILSVVERMKPRGSIHSTTLRMTAISAYRLYISVTKSFNRYARWTCFFRIFSPKALQSLGKNTKIAVDIKCSGALKNALKKLEIETIFCPTGCAYVKNAMKNHNALFGGELSGHLCFLDRYYGFDDGIYAMMRFLEIAAGLSPNYRSYVSTRYAPSTRTALSITRSPRWSVASRGERMGYAAKNSIGQILSQYPKSVSEPEHRIACDIDTQELINSLKNSLPKELDHKNIKYDIITIDGIRIDTPNSWGIIRASNTEPMLSFRFEANSEIELKKIKMLFYEAIIKYFYSDELKDKLLR